jgi:hypothetical protein
MTTRTRCDRNVADSHLNRSILQRLSFHVAEERQPGRAIGVLSRPVVMGENPANHVFVDGDVERQGDLLDDSRTAPTGITLLHFDDRMNEMYARSFRTGLSTAIR